MFFNFDEESRKIIISAKKEMKKLNHLYVGSEHLLLSILKYGNSVKDILSSYNLTYDNLKNEILKVIGKGDNNTDVYLYTPLFKNIIENSIIVSRENKIDLINTKILLLSLLEEQEGIAFRLLKNLSIDTNNIYKSIQNDKNNLFKKEKKKLLIEEYGYDMSKKNINDYDPIYGREKEINRIIEILLRRRKNNPLLIGDAGVGKTAIVEELSRRILSNNVPLSMKNKRIISVSMSSLVGGTKYRGEFEDRINNILKEIEEQNDVILFIDEIHTLMGAGGAEGAIDASNILKPYLARGKIKVIGATTTYEYKKYLEEDKALDRRFQIVNIDEPSSVDVLSILKKLKPIYETYHNVRISDAILNEIVELSNKYILNRKQPDKSIDVLDEVCAKVSLYKDNLQNKITKIVDKLNKLKEEKNKALLHKNFQKATSLKQLQDNEEIKLNKLIMKNKKLNKEKNVTLKDVAEIVKYKTNIPIYEILPEDSEKLKSIYNRLIKKVKGQDNIIMELCDILKKSKLGFYKSHKPISFLFLGPSGCGKTYLSNVLSQELTENYSNLIKIDMSEYSEEHSISKIIGSPPGYVGFDNKNNILEEIKLKPYSIILFENIEKGSKNVLNLIYQILDDGKIKTSYNEMVDLSNNIIILTSSNVNNNDSIGFFNNNINDLECFDKINSKVTKVLCFNKLNEKNIKEIIEKRINNILKELGVNNIYVTKSDVKQLILESNFDLYGAKKVNDLVNNMIFEKNFEENKNISIKI